MPADEGGSRYVGERLDRLPMELRAAREASELERLERQLRLELTVLAGQLERERHSPARRSPGTRVRRHLQLVTSEIHDFANGDHAA